VPKNNIKRQKKSYINQWFKKKK